MRKEFAFGDFRLELGTAYHKWTHFKVRDHALYHHLVWGKISIIWGSPQLETLHVCNYCHCEVSLMGEDGISVCPDCGIVEGNTKDMTLEDLETADTDRLHESWG